MKNKYKVLLLSITIMLVTSILLGTSYSLWSTTNTQSETNVVNVGCFKITFIDNGFNGAGDIDLKNQYPISDVEGSKLVPYKFSIKNECSIASSYVINLETSKESNFNLDYLKVKFNEETPAIYSTGLENGTIVLDSYSSSAKKLETGILEEGEEKIYTLRAWIEESATTTTPNVMGATWKGKVVVTNEATPLNNSKVTIVNNGETINEEVVARTRYTYDLTGIDLGSTTNIYCTNGAEPTMDNNTLVIDKIHEDTICTTSNSIVDTITNKLSTTKTGIVMLSNEDDVTKMTIASGKEVALDLNGKEIKSFGVNETSSTTWNESHVVFKVIGDLIVNDTVGTGGAYTGSQASVFWPRDGGKLTINGGIYNGRHSVLQANAGGSGTYIEINGGTLLANLYNPICQENCTDCEIVVNNTNIPDSTHNGTTVSIWQNVSSLTADIIINNGTYDVSQMVIGTSATNQGTIEINGGTFTSTGRTILNNSGTININGGNFESTGSETIKLINKSTINITGGTFISYVTNAIYYNNVGATVNINQKNKPIYIASFGTDGTPAAIQLAYDNLYINANNADNCTSDYHDTTTGLCVYSSKKFAVKCNKDTTCNINGGTYRADVDSINVESGNVKIKNAYLISNNKGIYSGNYIPTVAAAIKICNTTINASNYDIYNKNEPGFIQYSNVTFSNGTTTPDNSKIYGTITETPDACAW